jgi:DNA invertase Pin-like site-specific DNA recombinase
VAIKIIKYVATNDRGIRVGETHHRAKLTDNEVEQIRDLYEFGGMTYSEIAKNYGVTKSEIAQICRYERRVQSVSKWKKIYIEVAES